MINKFRRLLIRIGKILPFVICSIVMFNYVECFVALQNNDFIIYGEYIIPNTNISFYINRFLEYDIQTLVVITIISVAIETCIYNKLACGYLCVNLLEKSYFDFELESTTIYIICIINILICGFLCYKGLSIIYQKQ